MSRGFTTSLSMLLLAALAVGAWWWFDEAQVAPPAGETGTEVEVVPVPVPPPAPAATQEPQNAAASPRVWLEVETLGAYLPPPPATIVQVVSGGRESAVPVAVIGGVGVGPEAQDRPGRALVRLDVDGRVLHRVVRREQGEAVARLELGGELELRGRVVDRAGAPLAGAQVWAGGDVGDQATTDADGRYAIAVRGGGGVPLVVRAVGKAWHHDVIELRPPLDGERLTTLGDDECALTVQFAGDQRLIAGAVAQVIAVGDELDTELLRYPFFAAGLLGESVFDEQGRTVVRGLPRAGQVSVIAHGPLLPATSPRTVKLVGANAAGIVQAVARPVAHGVVVDDRDRPLAGAHVWCWPQGRPPVGTAPDRWLLPVLAQDADLVWTASDERGAFAIALPAAKCELLVVTATTRLRLVVGEAPREALRLVVPGWREGVSELVVPPPVAGAAWAVRVSPFADSFVAVAADAPSVTPVPAPVFAQLRARVQLDGVHWSEPKAMLTALLGRFELAPALIGR